MMRNTLITIVLFIVLIACNQSTISLKPDRYGGCSKKTTQSLKELISQDSTVTDDFEQIFIPKSMDQYGKLKTIDFAEAQRLVCNLRESTILSYPLPIFEVKNKSQWVVFSNAEGMWGAVWAFILIDLNDKTIVKATCDHEREAPVGKTNFKKMDYSERFESLNLSDLNLNEAKIDGVSGATKTHDAYIQVLRNAINMYKF